MNKMPEVTARMPKRKKSTWENSMQKNNDDLKVDQTLFFSFYPNSSI